MAVRKNKTVATGTLILDNLQYWLEEYLPSAEGKKSNTLRSYKSTWRLFMKFFMKDGISARDVTYEMLSYEKIMDFLSWMEKERHCMVSTRNNRLAAINKFAAYSQNKDFNSTYTFGKAVSKIPYKKKLDSKERSYFTKEELKLFLELPTPKDNTGLRNHVLLSFMYASAARAEEVCLLKVKDIRFLPDGKVSVLIHGKGNKTRRIKISQKPGELLKRYIAYRRISNQPDACVFCTQRNDRMSVKSIEEIYKKYVTMAKEMYTDLFQEATYTPHSMRHTTAVHMLDAGVPLIVIKQFLGHENISTTEIYAKMSAESVDRKLADWDRRYWGEYMDETLTEEPLTLDSEEEIPDFLK